MHIHAIRQALTFKVAGKACAFQHVHYGRTVSESRRPTAISCTLRQEVALTDAGLTELWRTFRPDTDHPEVRSALYRQIWSLLRLRRPEIVKIALIKSVLKATLIKVED